MLQKKDDAALTVDENIQQLMLTLAVLCIFMGFVGIVSCVYQINCLRSIRRKHRHESTTLQSAAHIQNQTEHVYKIKASTECSRADMQDSLEREVEELREFQQQVRGELGSLRIALEVLSQRRQREAVRSDNVELERKGKME